MFAPFFAPAVPAVPQEAHRICANLCFYGTCSIPSLFFPSGACGAAFLHICSHSGTCGAAYLHVLYSSGAHALQTRTGRGQRPLRARLGRLRDAPREDEVDGAAQREKRHCPRPVRVHFRFPQARDHLAHLRHGVEADVVADPQERALVVRAFCPNCVLAPVRTGASPSARPAGVTIVMLRRHMMLLPPAPPVPTHSPFSWCTRHCCTVSPSAPRGAKPVRIDCANPTGRPPARRIRTVDPLGGANTRGSTALLRRAAQNPCGSTALIRQAGRRPEVFAAPQAPPKGKISENGDQVQGLAVYKACRVGTPDRPGRAGHLRPDRCTYRGGGAAQPARPDARRGPRGRGRTTGGGGRPSGPGRPGWPGRPGRPSRLDTVGRPGLATLACVLHTTHAMHPPHPSHTTRTSYEPHPSHTVRCVLYVGWMGCMGCTGCVGWVGWMGCTGCVGWMGWMGCAGCVGWILWTECAGCG
eukprot:gene14018-biopygen17067